MHYEENPIGQLATAESILDSLPRMAPIIEEKDAIEIIQLTREFFRVCGWTIWSQFFPLSLEFHAGANILTQHMGIFSRTEKSKSRLWSYYDLESGSGVWLVGAEGRVAPAILLSLS